MICTQAGCDETAVVRYRWPGKDEDHYACPEHGKKAAAVARTLGCPLEFTSLVPELVEVKLEPKSKEAQAAHGERVLADLATPKPKGPELELLRGAVVRVSFQVERYNERGTVDARERAVEVCIPDGEDVTELAAYVDAMVGEFIAQALARRYAPDVKSTKSVREHVKPA